MPNRNSKPAAVSARSLLRRDALQAIAKSSGLVVRSSHKFDAASFTMALLGSVSRGAPPSTTSPSPWRVSPPKP